MLWKHVCRSLQFCFFAQDFGVTLLGLGGRAVEGRLGAGGPGGKESVGRLFNLHESVSTLHPQVIPYIWGPFGAALLVSNPSGSYFV